MMPTAFPELLKLLQDIVDAGLISDAQLETVVYANMKFRTEIAPGDFRTTCMNLMQAQNGLLLGWFQLPLSPSRLA